MTVRVSILEPGCTAGRLGVTAQAYEHIFDKASQTELGYRKTGKHAILQKWTKHGRRE